MVYNKSYKKGVPISQASAPREKHKTSKGKGNDKSRRNGKETRTNKRNKFRKV